jgi:hypothetical protein
MAKSNVAKTNKPARRTKQQATPKKTDYGKYFAYAFLVAVIVFFAAIRFRLRTMPLERDEGEYAYAGQLMLQGIPPYKLAYTMKLPGTAAAYAAIMAVFGQTPTGIHLGLILVNAATVVLVYLLARRFSGRLAGVAAAASYAALTTSFSVLGVPAHAMHFVVFFAMAGMLVLLRAIESGRLWEFFASGLLLGLGFLMKQPGIVFVAFGGLYLLGLYLLKSESRNPIEWKSLLTRGGSYAAGAIVPFVVMCVILLAAGVFNNFWFWVFRYASQYTSELGLLQGAYAFSQAFPRIVGSAVWLWLISAVGLVALLWNRESRQQYGMFMGGLLFFSFLGVCPGFFFREHYFILMLPAVAILAGFAVQSATDGLMKKGAFALAALPVAVFAVALGYAVVEQSAFLFEMDPVAVCQARYSTNPFSEAKVISGYLEAHVPAGEPIAVLGSEPEIYFYSKRHSVTGFIYMYGLMERQKYAFDMQNEMIREVEAARPEYLVVAKNRLSWLPHQGSAQEKAMSAWMRNFLNGYEVVGMAERVGGRTEYRWDEDAKVYEPHSQNVVAVFKRKS